MVGAVVVKDGQIVGEGFHERAGRAHAEVVALRCAGELAKGADLYVNLEPCSHYGRTPPCVEAIIQAGIKKVYASITDPNPLVCGRGIARLREAGVEVSVGLGAEQAAKLNEVFIKYMATGFPFVIMKTAMSLDGKIATKTGDARWISSASSRRLTHQLRDEVDAIMVGSGTVCADNPRLTTRLPEGGRDPIRVIIDSQRRVPPTARVFDPGRVILATTKADPPLPPHVEMILFPGPKVDLIELAKALADREITSVLLEGGAGLNAAAIQAGIVDKVMFFLAPLIIGGEGAPTPVGGVGVDQLRDAQPLYDLQVCRVEEDILVEGYLRREGVVHRTC
jgi:diaminohydroxyphosphoribosylaminopyrimidine deaminase/5-amino-6-(5-phosphoribosylamino)uracil reductase